MNKTIFTRLIICITVTLIQFAMPSRVSACECQPFPSIVEEFNYVDAVFMGEVTQVYPEIKMINSFLDYLYNKLFPPPPDYSADVFSGRRIEMIVKISWKSVSKTKVTLRSHDDCGYGYQPLKRGEDYLIYTYYHFNDPKSDLYIGFCTRTVESSYATEDLSYLNTLPTIPLTPIRNQSWVYYACIALFAIASYLAHTIRRRKRMKLLSNK